MADENSGLLVRVLEIENVVWTKSAESSDKIRNIISSNHGWLIPKLVEKILSVEKEQGQEEIISRYSQQSMNKNHLITIIRYTDSIIL